MRSPPRAARWLGSLPRAARAAGCDEWIRV